jgi:hypothetical protein
LRRGYWGEHFKLRDRKKQEERENRKMKIFIIYKLHKILLGRPEQEE